MKDMQRQRDQDRQERKDFEQRLFAELEHTNQLLRAILERLDR
jgi:hypothetical protein